VIFQWTGGVVGEIALAIELGADAVDIKNILVAAKSA
jgi:hypothetical protein